MFVDAIDLCGVGLVDLVAELVARSSDLGNFRLMMMQANRAELDWVMELWSWLWCPKSCSHSRNCSRTQYLPWTAG